MQPVALALALSIAAASAAFASAPGSAEFPLGGRREAPPTPHSVSSTSDSPPNTLARQRQTVNCEPGTVNRGGAAAARLSTGANITRWFRSPAKNTPDHFANYIDDAEAALIRSLGLTHVRLCVTPSIIAEPDMGAQASRLPEGGAVVRPVASLETPKPPLPSTPRAAQPRSTGREAPPIQNPKSKIENSSAPVTLIEPRIRDLETAIRRLNRAGLLVVLELHYVPSLKKEQELDPAWQDYFTALWKTLSKRLASHDPDMLMFELINEPGFDKHETEWIAFATRLVAAIRENASDHTIIVPGPQWGLLDGFLKMRPLPFENLIYTFHYYEPFTFTTQGAAWATFNPDLKHFRNVPYPSTPEAIAPLLPALADRPTAKAKLQRYGQERWNAQKHAARFQLALDWSKTHNVPLYCGEFGALKTHMLPEHRAAWLGDILKILHDTRIPWAIWGWDDAFGLSRKLQNATPVIDPQTAEILKVGGASRSP